MMFNSEHEARGRTQLLRAGSVQRLAAEIGVADVGPDRIAHTRVDCGVVGARAALVEAPTCRRSVGDRNVPPRTP